MGSDRTQILSVELDRREAEAIMGVAWAVSTDLPCVCGADQPAHFCHILQDAKSKLSTALSQPEQGETPSLVLSDEDRKRLMNIAHGLLGQGYHEPPAEQAAFLRNLASQEHRG